MTWKKIQTNSTSKYYYTVQNISVIPNSKVYLKIKNADTPPTDTNGAIVLTSKNYLSSVLPTNSYIYVAEENGGIAGTIVSEVINQTNFSVETVHEDKTLTTIPTVISVPKGGLFVLQNKSDTDLNFKVSNQSGRGVLVKNQMFAIAFAKDTRVTVTGTAGGIFSYIITSSVNMTALDDQLQADINFIKAHLQTVNRRYITSESLDQIYSQLGRGSLTEELVIRGNNSTEHVFDTVKLNPVDTTVTSIPDRSNIEVFGDITFRSNGGRSTYRTAFSFTISSNPEDNSINDIYFANKDVRKFIDKVYIKRNPAKDRVQLILVTSGNYESNGKFRIRIDGCRLIKDPTPLSGTATREEVIYRHDNLEFYEDADRNELSSNLVENVNTQLHTKENFSFNNAHSSATKIVLTLQNGNVNNMRDAVVFELNEGSGELIVSLGKTHYNGFQANKIYRIYTLGNKPGLTATFPIQLFSEVNQTQVREDTPDAVKYKFKLHRFSNVNRSYEFYKDFFRKIYDRMRASLTEQVVTTTSSVNIKYE
jgi:hypothetical protein